MNNLENRLKALHGRCQSVQNIVRKFAAPWIVEFAGLPRAGKSQCISIVEHFLRRNEFLVLAPFEGASQAPEYLKNDLVGYNIWTATYAIRLLLQGRDYRGPEMYDVVLLDRGVFDATAWFHKLENDKELTEEKRKILTQFVRFDMWRSLTKQVFVFTCEPGEALHREQREKLTHIPGLVTNKQFLESLKTAYCSAADCYKGEFRIEHIGTDNTRPQEVALEIAEKIFEGIEKNANVVEDR